MNILIPAKSFENSKTRLAPVLDAGERARLGAALLAHTIRICQLAFSQTPVSVVADTQSVGDFAEAAGADRTILARAHGLNAQLNEVAANLSPDGPLLVLHADLPFLTAASLHEVSARQEDVVIGPDRSGSGTNALLQRRSERFFRFGPGSCGRHREAAAEIGYSCALVERDEIARDLDDPGDWDRLGLSFMELLRRLDAC